MFYVLNFDTHMFTTCHTKEEVDTAVENSIDNIEIIDANDEQIRLMQGKFYSYCEVNGL